MRRQRWFTGQFATVGISYLGFTQFALLQDPPPELVYRRLNFPNGIPDEYDWTCPDPLVKQYGGGGVQRMSVDTWLDTIDRESLRTDGHIGARQRRHLCHDRHHNARLMAGGVWRSGVCDGGRRAATAADDPGDARERIAIRLGRFDERSARCAESSHARRPHRRVLVLAPSFTIDITIADGQTYQLALYLMDWDHLQRAQTVDLLDPTSNTLLNSQSVTAFSGGEYLVWQVRGHIMLRISNDPGAVNAVVSAIFFAHE